MLVVLEHKRLPIPDFNEDQIMKMDHHNLGSWLPLDDSPKVSNGRGGAPTTGKRRLI